MIVIFDPVKEALARILTLLLFFLLCFQITFFRRAVVKTPLYIPLILILLFQGISLLWAHNRIQGLEYWIHNVSLFLFFFVCLNLTTKKWLPLFLQLALLAAGIICIISFARHIFDVDLLFLKNRTDLHLSATFGNHKFVAEWIAPLIFWGIALYFLTDSRWKKRGYLLIVTFFLLTLSYLYKSRAALMGLFVTIPFLLCFIAYQKGYFSSLFRKSSGIYLKISLGFCVFVILPFLFFAFLKMFHIPLESISNSQRWVLATRTLAIALDHFWTGVGIGQFNIFFPKYLSVQDKFFFPVDQEWFNFIRQAHNEFLQLFAEGGIFVVLLWTLFFILLSWKTLEHFKKLTTHKPFVLSLYLSSLCSLVISFFSFNLQNPVSSYFLMASLGFLIAEIAPECKRSLSMWGKGGALVLSVTALYFLPIFLNRSYALYYQRKGQIYAGNKNLIVIEALNKSLTYQDDWETHYLIANAYHQLFLDEKAIFHIERSITLNPYYESSYYNLGIYNEKIHDWAKASKAYETLLSFAPDFRKANIRLGYLSLFQNKWSEAERYFRQVFSPTRFQPEEIGNAFLGLAGSHFGKKENQRALAYLTEAYQHNPNTLFKNRSLYSYWLTAQ